MCGMDTIEVRPVQEEVDIAIVRLERAATFEERAEGI